VGGDGGAVDGRWWASRRDSRWVGSAGGLGVPLTDSFIECIKISNPSRGVISSLLFLSFKSGSVYVLAFSSYMHRREPGYHACICSRSQRDVRRAEWEQVLMGPIAQCRGYCAHISAALRFGVVGFVNSKSMEGVLGSDEMVGLHERMGWGRRNEVGLMQRKPFWGRKGGK